MRLRHRLLFGAALFCALLAAASAQVTLASFTFEGDTPGNLPAGWLSSSNLFVAISNPNTSGINSSSTSASWSNYNSTDSALINLTGYTSGYTFTLAFDLYRNSIYIHEHGVLTGYGVSGSSADAWPIGSTLLNSGATMFDDLSAPATWQHFSFDFTSSVNSYLSGPGGAANFAIMFDMWGLAPGATPASIDNVTFTATAIPEPSTYAAIAGVAALGLVALRRRRCAA